MIALSMQHVTKRNFPHVIGAPDEWSVSLPGGGQLARRPCAPSTALTSNEHIQRQGQGFQLRRWALYSKTVVLQTSDGEHWGVSGETD